MSGFYASNCPLRFPGVTFQFLPADIISQILNFGAPAPIDLQVRGPDLDPICYGAKIAAGAASRFRAWWTRASSSR